MSTSRPAARTRAATGANGTSTRVLAAAGASPDGWPVVAGELVWVATGCAKTSCACLFCFSGASSGGLCDVAVVTTMVGVPRTSIRRSLVAAMVAEGNRSDAARRGADHLLDLAADHLIGTYFRRERGAVVPFPPGTFMQRPGLMITPAPGSDR